MPIIWTHLEGASRKTRKGFGSIAKRRDGTIEVTFPEWNHHGDFLDKRVVVIKPVTVGECELISSIGASAAADVHNVKLDAEEMKLIEAHRAKVAEEAAQEAENAKEQALFEARLIMFQRMDVEQVLDYFDALEKQIKGQVTPTCEQREELWDAFEYIGHRMKDLIKNNQQLTRDVLDRVRAVRTEDRFGCECRIDTVYGGYEDVEA